MELETAFRAQLGAAGAELDTEVGTVLAQLDADARAAWPGVHVDGARFGARLAELVHDDAAPLAALARLHAVDLYLSLACADGDATAVALLDRGYLADVRAPLSRMGLTASQIDETLQVMREELLVRRPDAPPRIASYGGRGLLRGWLRAVAARTGLRLVQHPERHGELDDRLHAQAGGDLELSYMKKTYGDAFHRAFRAALAGLDADARLLLKQRFRHGLTVEELGTMHAVHAGTISRWVATARERLVHLTRDAMMRELGVGRGDVSSILRMIHSELDISLGTIDTPPPR